jgi:hypothetical protein
MHMKNATHELSSTICNVAEVSKMAQKKQSTKQERLKKALPVLGIAGVSFSLVGGAAASASAPTADIPSQNTSPRQEIFLGEEELSDVSLATFYVFDKEGIAKSQSGQQLAWWRCGGCGRCGGCAWRGCGGCGGCGGCCFSIGRCRAC